MLKRNRHLAELSAGYLFPEIARRRREFEAAHPAAKLISLGIGNTTEPLTPHITSGLVEAARQLGTVEGYSGYADDSAGLPSLRQRIAQVLYQGRVSSSEVFISDGAKCDIGRLQIMFGADVEVAIQDPSYPVYVDGSVMLGAGGAWNGRGYDRLHYLPCKADNDYFPDLDKLPTNGLIYFCSPNNPTGAVADRAKLTALVETALKKGSLIVFDAAYAEFIRDKTLPKSIFEIEAARQCAIEVNSFSKPIGFTGVRLGWTVVPKELRFADAVSINSAWARVGNTIFNGASNIAQYGGLAALEPAGLAEMHSLIDFYLTNARLIRDTLTKLGVETEGGINAPYIWAHFPGRDSWEVFSEILEHCQLVTTPGSGFGPAGEGYIRFSAFGHRADVEEACRRLAAWSVKP